MDKSARQRAQELGLGVFKICEELHGSNNGSCDRLDNKKEKLYIDILESYLAEWVDYKQSIMYDTAVKRLIETTIHETKYLWMYY
jgi:hypothetical protein